MTFWRFVRIVIRAPGGDGHIVGWALVRSASLFRDDARARVVLEDDPRGWRSLASHALHDLSCAADSIWTEHGPPHWLAWLACKVDER